MKTLDNYDVVEMTSNELENTQGGWIICAFIIAAVAGLYVLAHEKGYI